MMVAGQDVGQQGKAGVDLVQRMQVLVMGNVREAIDLVWSW